MRRITFWLLSTLSIVVLLFGYDGSTSATPSTPAAAVSRSTTATTVAGDAASTRWGPVQVELTINGTKITKVTVVQSPSENPKDVEINDYALPILTQETTTSQSADIDMVSGATVTSEGYLQSLQSAIDKAGL